MELAKITEALDKAGVPGNSVIKDVVGKGHWGTVSDDFDFASSALSNVYIFAYCPPEMLKQAVETIRPVLNKYGGVCYISESMEIRSMKCIAKL